REEHAPDAAPPRLPVPRQPVGEQAADQGGGRGTVSRARGQGPHAELSRQEAEVSVPLRSPVQLEEGDRHAPPREPRDRVLLKGNNKPVGRQECLPHWLV